MKRPTNPMPDDVRDALEARGLMDRYALRPWYQRNDYLGWIARAKRAETRARRLDQMLDELEEGTVYMKMAWRPKA
ncbi:MAG: YdeI/OmpD-associated family protein [Rubricella sp.]